MQASKLAGYTLVLVLGFVAGWLLRPLSDPAQDKINGVQAHTLCSRIAAVSSSDSRLTPQQAPPFKTSSRDLTAKVATKQEVELVAASHKSGSYAELRAFIQHNGLRELHNHTAEIAELYGDSEFIEQLLAGYLGSEDDKIAQRLKSTIVKAMFDESSKLENILLEKIRSGNNASDWLRLLAEVGVRQEDSLRTLSEQLPQLY